ncbi:hypothetical protein AKG34_12045 [Peribacillus butanolivorans]|nr:hypothetical protein AKG34_12045 [Peribacillus butanolivorans]
MMLSTNFYSDFPNLKNSPSFKNQKAHHKIDCVHANAIHSQFYDGLITKQFILLAIHLITYNKNKKQDVMAICHYLTSMIFLYFYYNTLNVSPQ